MSSIPLGWPTPNYINPPTSGWAPVAVLCILSVLAIAVMCARMWVRIVKLRNVGPDDWTMLVGLVIAVTYAVGTIWALRVGQFDRHIWDIPPSQFVILRKIEFIAQALLLYGTGAIKISILLFLLRFTGAGITRAYLYITWVCIVFVASSIVAFTIVLLVECQPLHAYWDQANPIWLAAHAHSYHCIDDSIAGLTVSIVSLTQDFLSTILPISLFWSLRVSWHQRAKVLGMFALGFSVCGTGIVRFYYLYQATFGSKDTWDAGLLLTWATVEMLLAIICASIPAVKVLFEKRRTSIGVAQPRPPPGINPRSRSIDIANSYSYDLSYTTSDFYSTNDTSASGWTLSHSRTDSTSKTKKDKIDSLTRTFSLPQRRESKKEKDTYGLGQLKSIQEARPGLFRSGTDRSATTVNDDLAVSILGNEGSAMRPQLFRQLTLGDVHVEHSVEIVEVEVESEARSASDCDMSLAAVLAAGPGSIESEHSLRLGL